MKATNFTQSITILAIIIFSNTSFAYQIDGVETNAVNALRIYEEEYSTISNVRVTEKALRMAQRGLNLKEFSEEILANDQTTHYWTMALLFLATYYQDNYSQLGREMISFIQRKEKNVTLETINAKITALSNLQGILSPEAYQKKEMVEFIDRDMDEFLKLGNITDPSFWSDYFLKMGNSDAIDSIPENFSRRCTDAARMCLYASINITLLQKKKANPEWLSLLEQCKTSPDLKLIYQIITSPRWEEIFFANKLDMFAYQKEKERLPQNEKEPELQRQRSLEIREKTRKINEERNKKQ
jgi:hypothetical protein